MRTQQGSLFQCHGAWYVRFREQVQQTDGSIKWAQRAKRLASVTDYPKKSEVIPLKNEEMARLNKVGFTVEAGVSIVDFAENVYFPSIEKRLKPSTVKGYKDAWHCHIRDRVTAIRVRDFRTLDGENLMQSLGREHGRKLAHGTYKHIKVTLSAMFTEAKHKGLFDGANPMQGVSIPKGKKHGRKRLTYPLVEIEQHLDLFKDDPILIVNEDGSTYAPEISARVIRAVIGVAAFAGLREGEFGVCGGKTTSCLSSTYGVRSGAALCWTRQRLTRMKTIPASCPSFNRSVKCLTKFDLNQGRAGCSETALEEHSISTILPTA